MSLQKLTRTKPNVNLLNVNAYAKFGLPPSMRSEDVERKWSRYYGITDNLKAEMKIMTITKGHNCVVYLQILIRNKPNLYLVNVYAYVQFRQFRHNPSANSQDIKREQNSADNQWIIQW